MRFRPVTGAPLEDTGDHINEDTVPIPQPTEYAEELAGLANPAWATVAPILEFNGVGQSPAADTAFGVDIEAEITNFSEDWDVVSFNG